MIATNKFDNFFSKNTFKVFLSPILQNLNKRYILDNLKKRFSWWAEKDAVKEKILSLQEYGQKPKMVIKIQFSPSCWLEIFPFL